MPGYLDEILAHHRDRASATAGSLDIGVLAEEAAEMPAPRPFVEALSRPGTSVIAEIKRRSPSKGELAPGLDPASLAASYERGGAACLSVLTDGRYFGGSLEDLAAARAACALPVLRKDFTVCDADIYEARRAGADAVLLIAAALSADELEQFRELAESLGMAALVEVHDEEELDVALACGAGMVGVNQRDLRSFAVDTELAVGLGARIPPGVVGVAESGIRSREDVARLEDAGYGAVLIGETLVMASDPVAALRHLRGAAEEDAECS